MTKVYIIHENSEWTVHLTKRLEELQVPYEEWHLDKGLVNLTEAPPEGIYYNRMSASSHTRNHRFAPELTSAVLAWLEHHNRTIFNGSNALRLELSKVLQYTALEAAGIKTPRTIAAVGNEQIIKAAQELGESSYITKHNRAGKGLGVQLFHSIEGLQSYVEGPTFEEPVDGVTLIQQYIKSPEPFITRCEFIDGKFQYAVKVDTSEGFELCPADACQIDDLFCPVGETPNAINLEQPKFQIIENFDDSIIDKYEYFLKQNQIKVAGIEFIRDTNGEIYTYDVNTNTNYNADAEKLAGHYNMLQLATVLKSELEKNYSKA